MPSPSPHLERNESRGASRPRRAGGPAGIFPCGPHAEPARRRAPDPGFFPLPSEDGRGTPRLTASRMFLLSITAVAALVGAAVGITVTLTCSV